jgi:hypothetical protein
MNLSSIPLRLTQAAAPTPEQPVSISTMAMGDLFTYDEVSFKDPAIVDQQLGKFVQEVKDIVAKYGQPFIDHFKSQAPTVLGYSSIDGDPNQEIRGAYQPCAGNKIRRDYDLCLSQERAKVIADELNKRLPELGGSIKFKGMGETTQWGPGWTKESPTIPEKTAPNRRYVLSPIKPFVGKAQAGTTTQAAAHLKLNLRHMI